MNIDLILETFHRQHVAFLLIGGVNFLLRHAPVLTFDIDLWIDDTPQNRDRCEKALSELRAEWGTSDGDWGPVAEKSPGWTASQGVFCLTSPLGAIDIFRWVAGLSSWGDSRARAESGTTAAGIPFLELSDADMLQRQMALPESERKQERIRILKRSLAKPSDEQSSR